MKLTFKIIFSLILAVICWEFILETTVIKHPGTNIDKIRGKIYKQGVYVFGEEGFSINHINKLGLRGTEIKPKKINEYRIVFLGDSFTESFQVEEKKSFPSLLGRKLNQQNKKLFFNTINAGMGGYSPAFYIYLSNFYNSVLKPDCVVIQLNDKDFSIDLFNKQQKIYVSKYRNSYIIVKNDKENSSNKIKNILSRISFVRIIREKYEKFCMAKSEIKNLQNPEKVFIEKDAIYWTLKELKSKYKNIVILYLPDFDYFKTNETPSIYESLVKKYAEANNITFIDMRQDYLVYYKLYKQPSHGFYNTKPGEGHINKIGHRLITERLFEYFNKRL